MLFQCLGTVSDHCRDLEMLRVARSKGNRCESINKGLELCVVIQNCHKLRQVCICHCRLNVASIEALAVSRSAYLFTGDALNLAFGTAMASNSVCIGEDCLHWHDLPQNIVEECVQHCLNAQHFQMIPITFHKFAPNYDILSFVNAVRKGRWRLMLQLHLTNCTELSSDVFAELIQLPYLHTAIFYHNQTITDFDAACAAKRTSMKHIFLRGFTVLTIESVYHIATYFPNARIRLENMPQVRSALHASIQVVDTMMLQSVAVVT